MANFNKRQRYILSIVRASFKKRLKYTFFKTNYYKGTFLAILVKNIKKDRKTTTYLYIAYIFLQNKTFWFYLLIESLNLYFVKYIIRKLIPKFNINKDI